MPEFEGLVSEAESNLIKEEIEFRLNSWGIEDFEMKSAERDVLRERMREFWSLSLKCDEENLNGKIEDLAAKSLGLTEEVREALCRERKYRAALKNYNSYQSWKNERNPKRKKLEEAFGFDCYSHETEFLTENGWKFFDDIADNEKLATVFWKDNFEHRKFGIIEYQNYVEKFDSLFTGNLYKFFGHHTETLVTPNHRMFYREYFRKNDMIGDHVLREAALMPDSFDFLRTITNEKTVYELPKETKTLPIKLTAYMSLMGWFLSEGTVCFKEGKEASIRISQKKGGRLHNTMADFISRYSEQISCSLTPYEKSNTNGEKITELLLYIGNPDIVNKLYTECSHYSSNKRIPRWVFGLSKRMMEILFDNMVLGDGTIRKTSKESIIYYTISKYLADDVNELAVHCGWETSVWGPYKNKNGNDSYQVHVNKNVEQYRRLNKRSNITKMPVANHRIVCFSVPNGVLVTRYNGKVSFHGNSKHASHLIRLLRQGVEILSTGNIEVKRHDSEELIGIRNGLRTFEDIEEEAIFLEQKMDVLYKENPCGLPKSPDYARLDSLLQEIILMNLR